MPSSCSFLLRRGVGDVGAGRPISRARRDHNPGRRAFGLLPPAGIAALADALVRVIEDESLRSRLARGARDRLLERFDVRRYAARLGQLHAGLFAPQRDNRKPVGKGQIS